MGIGMGMILQSLGLWLLPAHGILVTIAVFIIVACISYGFELYSKFTGHGVYEVLDAVASVIGGLVGMGAGWLMALLYR